MKWLKSALPPIEALSHLSVICGIVFVALEYSNQAVAKREQNALDFLQQFHEGSLTDARLRLQSYWLNMPLGQISGRPGSAGVIDSLASAQIFPAGGANGAADLIRLVERLDVIAICVSSNVCDRSISVLQLGEYAANLLCIYRAPLEKLREDFALPDLGKATETVLAESKTCG